ncbi:hypothetical protein E2562_005773 [Oryza meyeriana var. granulata]|uniref:Reverse transcriptase/retrotransposon-derived protein RNase H-like domain-containing protein n=1 Tax=Oryza meyeriana var. granulata TaxID=110450 RepID=A0A6G1F4K4_9ORYZ|nr:hypothetical protein E2562_005773 [Oryza meyeriana var. granulata]
MKIPGPSGVITVRRDQDAAQWIDYRHSPRSNAKMIHNVGDHEADEAKAPGGAWPARAEAEGSTHAMATDPAHLERAFQISDGLSPEAEAANQDLPGVDRSIIEHKLHVHSVAKLRSNGSRAASQPSAVFLAKLAENCLLFFAVFRGASPIKWIDECQQAFDGLKAHLARLTTMATPSPS